MRTVGAHVNRNDLAAAKTVSVSADATHMMIHCTTQNVRITLDGTAPTITLGLLIVAASNPVLLPVPSGGSVKMIEVATTAVADYQFFAYG